MHVHVYLYKSTYMYVWEIREWLSVHTFTAQFHSIHISKHFPDIAFV